MFKSAFISSIYRSRLPSLYIDSIVVILLFDYRPIPSRYERLRKFALKLLIKLRLIFYGRLLISLRERIEGVYIG